MRMEVPAQEVEDPPDERVAKRIKHLIPGFAGDDEVPGAQDGQMLRDIRLLQLKPLVDARDRDFSLVAQELDDGDPRGMRQGLKDFRLEAPQFILHEILQNGFALSPARFSIFAITNIAIRR